MWLHPVSYYFPRKAYKYLYGFQYLTKKSFNYLNFKIYYKPKSYKQLGVLPYMHSTLSIMQHDNTRQLLTQKCTSNKRVRLYIHSGKKK